MFPQADAPFPQSIAVGEVVNNIDNRGAGGRRVFTEKNALFSGANVCQDGVCSCEYTKVSYRDGTVDYWPLDMPGEAGIPNGVCESGQKAGQPCDLDVDCDVVRINGDDEVVATIPGKCSTKEREETHVGQLGYCLERDLSRPINGEETEFACMTWLPIDVSASNVDVFNLNPEAGYYPPIDSNHDTVEAGQVYCTDSDAHGKYTYETDLSNDALLDQVITLAGAEGSHYYGKLINSDNYTTSLPRVDDQDRPLSYVYSMVEKICLEEIWFKCNCFSSK